MIFEYLYLAVPTILVLVCFHWIRYRDMRRRRIECYRFDLMHHVYMLLIEAKKTGHIDGDLPDHESIKSAVFDHETTEFPSVEKVVDSAQTFAHLSKYPNLMERYRHLSAAAVKLSFTQSPGKTLLFIGSVSVLIVLSLGAKSFRDFAGKRAEVAGGSILSRLPIRLC
jgi:hypothetical protein